MRWEADGEGNTEEILLHRQRTAEPIPDEFRDFAAREYGGGGTIQTIRQENVYYLNADKEIDFIVPDKKLAIQVSYSIKEGRPTTERCRHWRNMLRRTRTGSAC